MGLAFDLAGYTNRFTARDLRSLWTSLLSCGILSRSLTETCLATHQRLGPNRGYGCGIYKRLDESMLWISGSDAGVGSFSACHRQLGVVASVLSNVTDGEEEVRAAVLELLAGMEVDSAPSRG